MTMRFAFQHVFARAALAVTVTGLIAVPATAGSASAATAAADCTWALTRSAVPDGLSWFSVLGASQQSFAGLGRGPGESSITRAVLWTDRGAQATVLDSPGKGNAIAVDVNNHGVVVANDWEENRPYIWSKGKVTRLAKPAGASSAQVSALNDSGTIVGSAIIDDQTHGIVWSASRPGKYRDLGTSTGNLTLNDIDNSGTIVGTATGLDTGRTVGLKGTVSGGLSPVLEGPGIIDTSANIVNGPYILGSGGFLEGDDFWNYASFVWNDGAYTKMPTNEGPNAVNHSGLLAGTSSVDVGPWSTSGATVWKDGVSTVLPTYLPATGAYANGVTDDGVVIGTSWSSTDSEWPNPVPVTWTCS
jgi:uncharacterized membrane protein